MRLPAFLSVLGLAVALGSAPSVPRAARADGFTTLESGSITFVSSAWASSTTRLWCKVTTEGHVVWEGGDPFDVAAIESAAKRDPANAGLLRALARLTRLEAR